MRSSGIIEKIDDIDEIFTLEDCNQKQPVQYKFPDITNCPVELCRREFGSRRDAFNHFKQRHFKNSQYIQYCSTCDELIEVYRSDDVREHKHRVHRNENVALDFDRSSNVSRQSSSTENVCIVPKIGRQYHSRNIYDLHFSFH